MATPPPPDQPLPPPIPPQGFAPHVEIDETGRIVFAPPASLDSAGNNLPRLRNLLPQLIEIADELRDLLTRGNQPHPALIARLAAYRARLAPDLAQVTLPRVVTEALRLESAAAAAQAQIAAKELPPHDAEADEALASLLRFNRMFAMATADGPAMLADEARYNRSREEEAAHQAALRRYAAAVAQNPAAVADDVRDTLSATINEPGDTLEAARTRLNGEGLAFNITVVAVGAASLATAVTALAAAGPAGNVAAPFASNLLSILGGGVLGNTRAFRESQAALGLTWAAIRDLRPARLRAVLAPVARLAANVRGALEPLAALPQSRFAWLRAALPWLDRATQAAAPNTPESDEPEWEDDDFWKRTGSPPPDFSETEAHKRILAGIQLPAAWRPFVTALHFDGERAFRDLTLLTALANLQTLHLDTTRVADLAPLAALANLQTLGLTDTPVTDLTPLAALTNLQALHLNRSQVADLTPLAGLVELQDLRLDRTKVADITPLAVLSELKTLWLSGTQVTDLTSLAGFAHLGYLGLDNTQVADLAPLAALTDLQELRLSGTQVADLTPLAALVNLQTLTLNDTQVADLTPLAALANLQTLILDRTPVTDLTPIAALANLQNLTLNHTQVADLAPLAALTNLRNLSLNRTQVADLIPLTSLANLELLNLADTQATDVTPLAALANLQFLFLDNTRVTDASMLPPIHDLRLPPGAIPPRHRRPNP